MAQMNGKTVVVTGATTGIGRAAALALAKLGAKVVIAVRDEKRGAELVGELKALSPAKDADMVVVDFANLGAVRGAAAKLLERYPKIDVLVNNAGLLATRRDTTVDGLERTFAVNTVAPLLFTEQLLPALKAAAPSRVVMVSSDLHYRGQIAWDDLQLARSFGAQKAYAQSKLALVMITRQLAKRLAGTGVTVNAVHPGVIASDFARELPWVARVATKLLFASTEKGAAPLVRLAAEDDVAQETGQYFSKLAKKAPHAAARDDATCERMWKTTAALAGLPS